MIQKVLKHPCTLKLLIAINFYLFLFNHYYCYCAVIVIVAATVADAFVVRDGVGAAAAIANTGIITDTADTVQVVAMLSPFCAVAVAAADKLVLC